MKNIVKVVLLPLLVIIFSITFYGCSSGPSDAEVINYLESNTHLCGDYPKLVEVEKGKRMEDDSWPFQATIQCYSGWNSCHTIYAIYHVKKVQNDMGNYVWGYSKQSAEGDYKCKDLERLKNQTTPTLKSEFAAELNNACKVAYTTSIVYSLNHPNATNITTEMIKSYQKENGTITWPDYITVVTSAGYDGKNGTIKCSGPTNWQVTDAVITVRDGVIRDFTSSH